MDLPSYYKFNHFPRPAAIEKQLHGKALLLGSMVSPLGITELPSAVDLRTKTTFPVYDQGNLGSCTANATTAAIQFLDPTFQGSRLYLYYYARAIRGNQAVDSGSSVTDSVTVISTRGLSQESVYPYNISDFNIVPSGEADADASNHRGIDTQSLINTPGSLKGALAAGYPIPIGFTAYQSIMSADVMRTGIVPVPDLRTDQVVGGHCVVLWGYDDVKQWYIMRNSWGASRGDNGYFYMPYAIIHDPSMTWDPWVIRKMNSPAPLPTPVPAPVRLPPGIAFATPAVTVSPGTYTYQIPITNNDSLEASIVLDKYIPKSLTGSLGVTVYKVPAHTTLNAHITIKVPPNILPGTYEIGVVATSKSARLPSKARMYVTVLP
jgi:hypothetical protein